MLNVLYRILCCILQKKNYIIKEILLSIYGSNVVAIQKKKKEMLKINSWGDSGKCY